MQFFLLLLTVLPIIYANTSHLSCAVKSQQQPQSGAQRSTENRVKFSDREERNNRRNRPDGTNGHTQRCVSNLIYKFLSLVFEQN